MTAFFLVTLLDMEKSQLHKLGTLIKLHGFKGEFTAWLDTAKTADYKDVDTVFLEGKEGLVPFTVLEFAIKNHSQAKLKLEGIDSEADAKPWLKCDIYIPNDEVSEHDELRDSFRHWVGYQVYTEGRGMWGVISDIQENPVNPQIIIDSHGIEVLVPLQPEFVDGLDVEKKVVTLTPPDGLLELFLGA